MTRFADAITSLRLRPRTWLVTGAAGFIGSHLLEQLLELDQTVVGVDNFATGHQRNLDQVLERVGPRRARRFRFLRGDILDLETCRAACEGVELVLHQAALGSVPRSVADPIVTNATNVTGFLNLLVAARDARVRRFVYAASSSTYGDHPGLPKVEGEIGRPLSPYAVTKHAGELYAHVFQRCYGLETVGLRYFNVFGPRQDPEGAYAAVIPRWAKSILSGEPCVIYGDGETSRDFTYVGDAVQANLLAATAADPAATDQVYNVACGQRTTLIQLFRAIRAAVAARRPEAAFAEPEYREFRPADVRHSLADISKIEASLGYRPVHSVGTGLQVALSWYMEELGGGAEGGEAARPEPLARAG